MKRILVVGPGPLRPGVGPHASVVAAELATAFADVGLTVVAVDSSPASVLLASSTPSRRYVEPLDPAVLEKIVAAESIEAIAVRVAGPHVVHALAPHRATRWLGGSAADLDAERRAATVSIGAASSADEVLDVVAAGDGTDTTILAMFGAKVEGWAATGVAIADAEHTWIREERSGLEDAVARAIGTKRGIFTVRCAVHGGTIEVVARDPIDTSLWLAAGLVRGVRMGTLLARILLGDPLEEALRDSSARPIAEALVRTPSFDFDPFPGADRTLGAAPKSLGATIAVDTLPTAEARSEGARRVLLVGPGAVTVERGAEASTAVFLAAREVARLGHELVLVTPRDGTGAEGFATRWYPTFDVAGVIGKELPTDVLTGFGSPARAAMLEGDPISESAVELHVLVMTDGKHARILGTFEHVERAAVHADDAAAVFPSLAIDDRALRTAEEQSIPIATSLGARGPVTLRWAITTDVTFAGASAGVTSHLLSLGLVLGVDLVAEAVRVALGASVEDAGVPIPRHVAIEEHVFPFAAFGATDTKLDRRRRGTGSVLAIADTTPRAYARSLAAMGVSLRRPEPGKPARAIVLAGGEDDGSALADLGKRFFALGFDLVASGEAARWLDRARIPHRAASDAGDLVARREVAAVVATGGVEDGRADLRHAALVAGVPCFTTVDLVKIAVRALEESDTPPVRSLESWNAT